VSLSFALHNCDDSWYNIDSSSLVSVWWQEGDCHAAEVNFC